MIPAIDLRGGRCVRLTKGDFGRETVYSDDPVETARRFRDEGAVRVHIVDLDGAREGLPRYFEIAGRIAAETGMDVEYGGGIRSMKSVEEAVKSGVARVILGTVAVRRPEILREAAERYGRRIWAAVDVRSGGVMAEGWLTSPSSGPIELVSRLAGDKVGGIIYTDTERDGTLEGVSLDSIRGILSFAGAMPVVYAGGVRDISDIIKMKTLEKSGLEGVIAGKALYEGTLLLREALAASRAV